MTLVIVFEAFAIALFSSCLCRASYTNKANTKRDIRWAFTFLGVMSLVAVLAPLLWGYEPDGMSTALLAAMTVVQLVTSHHWRNGVPAQFRRR